MIGSTGSTPASSPRADVVTLRFLHTNDMHGTITPVHDTVILGRPAELGGVAYMATLVERLRGEAPEHTMLLDAGDAVHGQAATDLTEGMAMSEVMNTLRYDAGTIGNHDPAWGVAAMERRLANDNFPTVLANVEHDDGTPLPNSQPYLMKDLGGVKVAVMGMLTPETVTAQRADRIAGLRFKDEQETLEHFLPEMQERGADLRILLTHDGLAADKAHAETHPDHKLFFVGGHSHDRTPELIEVCGNWVMQAGSMGRELGVLEIDFDRVAREIVAVRHRLEAVDPSVLEANPEVAAIVDRYQAAADEKMGKVVAALPDTLTRDNREDSPLGNVVTDAMRELTGADVALMNSDGLRRDLPAGEVTVRSLYEVMPFGGALMKGSLKGRELLEALEKSATLRQEDQEVQSPFLQVSGVRFEYDANLPPGQRVLSAEVGGKPLEPGKTYSVALEDFLAAGKVGYEVLGRARCQAQGMSIIDAVGDHLEKHGVERVTSFPRILDRTRLLLKGRPEPSGLLKAGPEEALGAA